MTTQVMVNTDAKLGIGINMVSGEPMLYVQDGNKLEYYAWFTSESKAEKFMKILKRWDESGGNDGDL